MHMRTCMHVYIYIHMFVCNVCAHVCMHVCVSAWIYVCVCVCFNLCAYMHASVYAWCVCMWIGVHVCMCIRSFWRDKRDVVELCIKEMYNSSGLAFYTREYHYPNVILWMSQFMHFEKQIWTTLGSIFKMSYNFFLQ